MGRAIKLRGLGLELRRYARCYANGIDPWLSSFKAILSKSIP